MDVLMKMHDLKNNQPLCDWITSPRTCIVFQAFSDVGSKFPSQSVAVMRWVICDLLSIKAETYQIIEMAFHLDEWISFSFFHHEVRNTGAEL